MPKASKHQKRRNEYLQYLQSDHWKNIRHAKLSERPNCFKCKSTKRLHVHHIDYKNLVDVTLDDLEVLCETCHDALHRGLKRLKIRSYDCPRDAIIDVIIGAPSEADIEKERMDRKNRRFNSNVRQNKAKKRVQRMVSRFKNRPMNIESLDFLISELRAYREELCRTVNVVHVISEFSDTTQN